MRLIFPMLAVAALLSVGGAPALADNAPEPGASPPAGSNPSIGDIVIGEIERRILRDYYQRQYDDWEHEQGGKGKGQGKDKGHKDKGAKGLPPGLAKRGELPPGLAKQLVRNGHLPPGLEGRDLPPDLLSRLPALDPAYRYVIADNKVMLVRRATNLILDVLTVAAVDLIN
ncbi:hypothetical protein [Dongia sp.]|uniref:hypothetical protein n=1 Tax=Dongia sp. TaxID=1977262 RepID=UPI0035AED563